MSLPAHCSPLLTSASFGFEHEGKSFKGSRLTPISALSLGTNSPTLYVMLKHNPSSKLNQKPHYSAQCTNQTRRTSLCIQLLTLLFPPVKLHVICTCVSARRERERERGGVQMKLQWFDFQLFGMCTWWHVILK